MSELSQSEIDCLRTALQRIADLVDSETGEPQVRFDGLNHARPCHPEELKLCVR